MAVQLQQQSDSKIVEINLSGKLTKEDYQQFVPQIEQQIREHGKIRVLFQMSDFHGWKAGALWEDIKFDVKHFSDIERLAMIGDKAWEKGMSVFCKPFTTAKIRFFHPEELDLWILDIFGKRDYS